MNESKPREFEDTKATREHVPIMLGLVGPSGTGKTFSALRLATGIQRVSGGDIFMIDTESRRGLHYADDFKFRHVPFAAPFSPLDYLAAVEHCEKQKAGVVIIDSMSHEHEGPGGVLEMHADETKRLAAQWKVSEDKAQMSAWNKPKSERRRMLNTLMQMRCNLICCFRAKEKLKIVTGKDPEPLGFMSIAGDEIVYEMLLKCLLLPGARGKPTWNTDKVGERLMMKLPDPLVELFREPAQLSEDIGEAIAQWADGKPDPVTDLVKAFDDCTDADALLALEASREAVWKSVKGFAKKRLKAAADAARERVGHE